MMWYWSGHMHWWGWFLGVAGMIVFWTLVIWGFWYLITGPRHAAQRPHTGYVAPTSDPKRILDERLVRGEISPEEYQHLCDVLAGGDSSSRPTTGVPG